MNIVVQTPDFFYPKQEEMYKCESRYTVVISANKTGKTLSMGLWINERALLGKPNGKYCWLAPYSKTARIGYELVRRIITQSELYQHLKDNNSNQQFKFVSSSPQKIVYPNGNVIDFIQGQNVQAIFGEQYRDAVVDEATRLKQEFVENADGTQSIVCPAFDALLTTQRISKGRIKAISNPTTRNNWFYQWYLRAKDGKDSRTKAFHLSSLDAIDAGFLSQEEFDYAKETVSPYIFKRDWLGLVPEEENQVFMADKVYECINDDLKQALNKVHYFGIDLGFTKNAKSDYTVVTGLNKNCEVVFFKRFKAEGDELVNKLKAYINNRYSYIDATAGGGHTVYTMLKTTCPNLEPFKFNNANKCNTIETLAHYIHNGKIQYPNLDILTSELLGYESEMDDKGTTFYSNGKSVAHDDSVISLGLAVLRLKEVQDDEPDYTYNVYNVGNETDIDWEGQGFVPDFSFNI